VAEINGRAPRKNENFKLLEAMRHLDGIIADRTAERALWEEEMLRAWPYCRYRYDQVAPLVPIHFYEERTRRGRMTNVNSGQWAFGQALEAAVELEQRADEGKRRRCAGWRQVFVVHDASGHALEHEAALQAALDRAGRTTA
jgi:hypothetical protein